MAHRLEKFASTLRQAVGEILQRDSLNPEFRLVAVTRVGLSRDLKRATVFVACPPDRAAELLDQLGRSTGFIKGRLGRRMILRTMPELEFALDAAGDLELRLERRAQGDGGAGDGRGENEETDR